MILSLFLGNRAANLGITSQYLDVYYNCDQFCYKINSKKKTLFYINIDHNKKPNSLYFGNDLDLKTQEVPIINEYEEDQPQIIKLTQKYLHEMRINQNQIDNYKKNFENEYDFIAINFDFTQVELYQDNIQTQLEKADQCDGFELIVDCETCYGEIGLKVVYSLNDLQGNSKSLKLVISIVDPYHQL